MSIHRCHPQAIWAQGAIYSRPPPAISIEHSMTSSSGCLKRAWHIAFESPEVQEVIADGSSATAGPQDGGNLEAEPDDESTFDVLSSPGPDNLQEDPPTSGNKPHSKAMLSIPSAGSTPDSEECSKLVCQACKTVIHCACCGREQVIANPKK